MSADITKSRTIQAREQPHDLSVPNGAVTHPKAGALPTTGVDLLPELPTFSLEVGWRAVYDVQTGAYRQLPLTLYDLLFISEDDIGTIVMAQSPLHDLLLWTIRSLLHIYRGTKDWLITQDVFVHFGGYGLAPKGPDIAVIPEGKFPAEGEKSYRVGRDGPPPVFVAEVTSEETRQIDLQTKPLFYASVGVTELLIIDILTATSEPWRLLGYRLTDGPYYTELTPDTEGGLTFITLGLRFVPIRRERIDVFDVVTKERLLTPEEQKIKTEATEAKLAEALTRLQVLEASAENKR